MTNSERRQTVSSPPTFFSYGLRPFFLAAALFAGLAIPTWMLAFTASGTEDFFYDPRDWHVHEMLFGFLPAVFTGFLLTAISTTTNRPPVRDRELMLLGGVWLAGRVVMAVPVLTPLLSAILDGAFLIVTAGVIWRELAAGQSWNYAPMASVVTLYAGANILFHVLALQGDETDLPKRMALALIMVLLTLIGGRVIPAATRDYLTALRIPKQLPDFSAIDGLSIVLSALAAASWMARPQALWTGGLLIVAGISNLIRLVRWYGWTTWREPTILVLHLWYGWLAVALLTVGSATLRVGVPMTDAIHALTTGAMGVMTLAVMTRASLGASGRPREGNLLTIIIFLLANLGAILRTFGPSTSLPPNVILSMAAVVWSSAFLLFVLAYGPVLRRKPQPRL